MTGFEPSGVINGVAGTPFDIIGIRSSAPGVTSLEDVISRGAGRSKYRGDDELCQRWHSGTWGERSGAQDARRWPPKPWHLYPETGLRPWRVNGWLA